MSWERAKEGVALSDGQSVCGERHAGRLPAPDYLRKCDNPRITLRDILCGEASTHSCGGNGLNICGLTQNPIMSHYFFWELATVFEVDRYRTTTFFN
jgi:hypothetical protein